jgi:hypothetical protein
MIMIENIIVGNILYAPTFLFSFCIGNSTFGAYLSDSITANLPIRVLPIPPVTISSEIIQLFFLTPAPTSPTCNPNNESGIPIGKANNLKLIFR